ncbi:hypothetical protein ACIBI7_49220 [Nonomuraea fuscirosea]|uniref:hypothetical protein n=1 Tax=Nonomuraea fuscirosea TaxID=1291556 RepID=UPI0037B906A9
MLKRAPLIIGTTLTLALSTGCTPEPAATPPQRSPEATPVIDAAPYWCEVIPQQGVRAISGLTMPLEESKWGALASHGGCSLRNEYSRFSLNWSINGGEEALGLARKNFGSTRLSELPADLGKGLIAYTGGIPRSKPYVAFILFRCGKNQPWMGTSLSQVAKERNVVKDLTDLLHIARDRYGKAHSCTPEAA